ncbi:MAG: squalene/oxidosqualene cyclase [Phycisphaerales bacterium]|nr:squalene/oxidosqualene cyclase [Phycisphaerales bacterium]
MFHQRRILSLGVTGILVALAIAAGEGERPKLAVARMPADPAVVSDAAVREALARGNEFLIAQFKDGQIEQGKDISPAFHQGLNALCVYALLNSGQATHDPRLLPTSDFMRRLIDNMKMHPMATDRDRPQSPVVYARSLRAAALAMYARPEDMEELADDVQWLVDASVEGAYSYDDRLAYRVIPDESGQREHRTPGSPRGTGMSPGSPRSPLPPGGTSPGGNGPMRPPGGSPVGVPLTPWRSPHPPERLPQPRIEYHPPINRFPPARPSQTTFRPPPSMPRGGGGGMRSIPVRPATPPPLYPPRELPEKGAGPFVWDNSNSQYGLFGVMCGAEAGIEVPDQYFQEVEQHWLTYQLRTGEWTYRLDRPKGYLAMTCAGIASLMTTHDFLEAPYVAKVGQQRGGADESLGAAFEWLARGDNAVTVDGAQKVYVGYTLNGVERVGLASGYKYLGTHDWYAELGAKVVRSQSAKGTWGKSEEPIADTLIDTAYSVLFLARGRHPVMMNKLQLDPLGKSDHGEWNNRPRDLANLAKFTSRELERPVQWQVVPLDHDPADWSDAPILYLASHAPLKLSNGEVAKISSFIDAGGMFFTQADDGAQAFNAYVDRLAGQLYPERELKDLPRDHEIYTLQYQIPPGKRPRLRGMVDGAGRLVWVHSPTDLAVSWQQRASTSKPEVFELGINLFAYAVGKSDLRNRLEPRAVPSPTLAAERSFIAVARIKHDGAWDPQPLAFERFGRWFGWETSWGLKTVATEASKLDGVEVAHLVLPVGSALAENDAAALRKFVSAGGTLIVESPRATSSAAALPKNAVRGDALGSGLGQAFAADNFDAVTQDHPLLNETAAGMEKVWPLKIRPYATKVMGDQIAPIRIATIGKGRVIHVSLDVTTGLLGCAEWGVAGYEPATCQSLMKNALVWSAAGAP